jgi:hypothetical protein
VRSAHGEPVFEASVTRQTRSGWVLLLRCLENSTLSSLSEAATEAPLLPALEQDVLERFAEFSDKHKEFLERPNVYKDVAFGTYKEKHGSVVKALLGSRGLRSYLS